MAQRKSVNKKAQKAKLPKEILVKKQEINALKRERKRIIRELEKVVKNIQDLKKLYYGDSWIDDLPLNDIEEFHKYEYGKKKNFALLDLFDLSELKKQHSERLKELELINSDIKTKKIEITMEQIKNIEKQI
jgi:hypothetical protein